MKHGETSSDQEHLKQSHTEMSFKGAQNEGSVSILSLNYIYLDLSNFDHEVKIVLT